MQFLPPRWFEELPSTNLTLRELLAEDPMLAEGTVIAARIQTAGRGRQGRRWISTPGRDLTFSFLLREKTEDLPRLASLPIAVALAVAELLESYGITPRLRWPNDVLIDEKKISGILVERTPHPAVIVGVGINIHMNRETAASIGRPTTSLALETGRSYSLDAILNSFLSILPAWISLWSREGFPGLRPAWLTRTIPPGEMIRVGHGAEAFHARIVDYGPHGELLVEGKEGGVRAIWSGELE